jgi:hypothetical protein
MTGDDETAKPMPEAGAAINNQKTNFDPIAVGDEIAALESEAQNAKVVFVSRSGKIAAILWNVKQHHPEHLNAICERAMIGRSRRKELLQIGRGSKTIDQSRRESAERQTKSRANKKAWP